MSLCQKDGQQEVEGVVYISTAKLIISLTSRTRENQLHDFVTIVVPSDEERSIDQGMRKWTCGVSDDINDHDV